jgi:CheY-like chemotaxis protein
MLSPVYNTNAANPTSNAGQPDARIVRLASSRLDDAQLDRSIRIAKCFSRRTAHDFNNIIAVMHGFGSLLQNRLKDDIPNCDMAGQITASGDEALKLTTWLSAFANNNPVAATQVDLSGVVDEFLSSASVELPDTVQVQINLSRDLPALNCDEEQLGRICRQLWQNAVEALHDGGRVYWETTLAQVTEQESGVESPYLRLRVSDSGEGMDESVKASMFDPFFTTRYGKDRGLGLTLVCEAVHAYQGFIEVSSEPSVGTCLDIYWPVLVETPPRVNTSADSGAAQELQKLLVVDDEVIIHVLVGEILKGQRLEVIGVSSGEEGLKSYQDSHGAVKAVILDVSLPGMDGLTTFHKLRELDPLVRVIVSSGDPNQQAVHDIMAAGAFGLIAKPFRPAHLVEVVRQVFGL